MLSRVVLALVVGIVAYLVCVLLGSILINVPAAFASAVGAFLKGYADLIGLLVAIWWAFAGKL